MGSYDGKYGHMCLLWFLNSTFNGKENYIASKIIEVTKHRKKNIKHWK